MNPMPTYSQRYLFNVKFRTSDGNKTDDQSINELSDAVKLCQMSFLEKQLYIEMYQGQTETFMSNLIALLCKSHTITVEMLDNEKNVTSTMNFTKCECQGHHTFVGYDVPADLMVHQLSFKYTSLFAK